MIHEDLSAVPDRIQSEEGKLIHEHYHIPSRLEGPMNVFVMFVVI
jgi:hypothetical protein